MRVEAVVDGVAGEGRACTLACISVRGRCLSLRRWLRQGFDLARVAALKFLDDFKQTVKPDDREVCLPTRPRPSA